MRSKPKQSKKPKYPISIQMLLGLIILFLLFLVILNKRISTLSVQDRATKPSTEAESSQWITKKFDRFAFERQTQKADFDGFTISYPSSWKVDVENEYQNDPSYYPGQTITFSKDNNKIVIQRGAIGGHLCNPNTSDLMSITTLNPPPKTFWLTNNPAAVDYLDRVIVCEKGEEGTYSATVPVKDPKNVYLTITSIGGIEIFASDTNPQNLDPTILSILESITVD